jgi:hypothetical protein
MMPSAAAVCVTNYPRQIDEMGFRVKLHGANFVSALGQKRTLQPILLMSALPPKAEIAERRVRDQGHGE